MQKMKKFIRIVSLINIFTLISPAFAQRFSPERPDAQFAAPTQSENFDVSPEVIQYIRESCEVSADTMVQSLKFDLNGEPAEFFCLHFYMANGIPLKPNIVSFETGYGVGYTSDQASCSPGQNDLAAQLAAASAGVGGVLESERDRECRLATAEREAHSEGWGKCVGSMLSSELAASLNPLAWAASLAVSGVSGSGAGCMGKLVQGIVDNFVGNAEGLWWLAKAAVGKGWLWGKETDAAQDLSAQQMQLAAHQSPEEVKSFWSDPLGWIKDTMIGIGRWLESTLGERYACQEWEGVPFGSLSKCKKALPCLKAASCSDLQNMFCGAVGFLGGEVISTFILVGAITKGAKAVKAVSDVTGISRVVGKGAEVLGGLGSKVGKGVVDTGKWVGETRLGGYAGKKAAGLGRGAASLAVKNATGLGNKFKAFAQIPGVKQFLSGGEVLWNHSGRAYLTALDAAFEAGITAGSNPGLLHLISPFSVRNIAKPYSAMRAAQAGGEAIRAADRFNEAKTAIEAATAAQRTEHINIAVKQAEEIASNASRSAGSFSSGIYENPKWYNPKLDGSFQKLARDKFHNLDNVVEKLEESEGAIRSVLGVEGVDVAQKTKLEKSLADITAERKRLALMQDVKMPAKGATRGIDDVFSVYEVESSLSREEKLAQAHQRITENLAASKNRYQEARARLASGQGNLEELDYYLNAEDALRKLIHDEAMVARELNPALPKDGQIIRYTKDGLEHYRPQKGRVVGMDDEFIYLNTSSKNAQGIEELDKVSREGYLRGLKEPAAPTAPTPGSPSSALVDPKAPGGASSGSVAGDAGSTGAKAAGKEAETGVEFVNNPIQGLEIEKAKLESKIKTLEEHIAKNPGNKATAQKKAEKARSELKRVNEEIAKAKQVKPAAATEATRKGIIQRARERIRSVAEGIRNRLPYVNDSAREARLAARIEKLDQKFSESILKVTEKNAKQKIALQREFEAKFQNLNVPDAGVEGYHATVVKSAQKEAELLEVENKLTKLKYDEQVELQRLFDKQIKKLKKRPKDKAAVAILQEIEGPGKVIDHQVALLREELSSQGESLSRANRTLSQLKDAKNEAELKAILKEEEKSRYTADVASSKNRVERLTKEKTTLEEEIKGLEEAIKKEPENAELKSKLKAAEERLESFDHSINQSKKAIEYGEKKLQDLDAAWENGIPSGESAGLRLLPGSDQQLLDLTGVRAGGELSGSGSNRVAGLLEEPKSVSRVGVADNVAVNASKAKIKEVLNEIEEPLKNGDKVRKQILSSREQRLRSTNALLESAKRRKLPTVELENKVTKIKVEILESKTQMAKKDLEMLESMIKRLERGIEGVDPKLVDAEIRELHKDVEYSNKIMQEFEDEIRQLKSSPEKKSPEILEIKTPDTTSTPAASAEVVPVEPEPAAQSVVSSAPQTIEATSKTTRAAKLKQSIQARLKNLSDYFKDRFEALKKILGREDTKAFNTIKSIIQNNNSAKLSELLGRASSADDAIEAAEYYIVAKGDDLNKYKNFLESIRDEIKSKPSTDILRIRKRNLNKEIAAVERKIAELPKEEAYYKKYAEETFSKRQAPAQAAEAPVSVSASPASSAPAEEAVRGGGGAEQRINKSTDVPARSSSVNAPKPTAQRRTIRDWARDARARIEKFFTLTQEDLKVLKLDDVSRIERAELGLESKITKTMEKRRSEIAALNRKIEQDTAKLARNGAGATGTTEDALKLLQETSSEEMLKSLEAQIQINRDANRLRYLQREQKVEVLNLLEKEKTKLERMRGNPADAEVANARLPVLQEDIRLVQEELAKLREQDLRYGVESDTYNGLIQDYNNVKSEGRLSAVSEQTSEVVKSEVQVEKISTQQQTSAVAQASPSRWSRVKRSLQSRVAKLSESFKERLAGLNRLLGREDAKAFAKFRSDIALEVEGHTSLLSKAIAKAKTQKEVEEAINLYQKNSLGMLNEYDRFIRQRLAEIQKSPRTDLLRIRRGNLRKELEINRKAIVDLYDETKALKSEAQEIAKRVGAEANEETRMLTHAESEKPVVDAAESSAHEAAQVAPGNKETQPFIQALHVDEPLPRHRGSIYAETQPVRPVPTEIAADDAAVAAKSAKQSDEIGAIQEASRVDETPAATPVSTTDTAAQAVEKTTPHEQVVRERTETVPGGISSASQAPRVQRVLTPRETQAATKVSSKVLTNYPKNVSKLESELNGLLQDFNKASNGFYSRSFEKMSAADKNNLLQPVVSYQHKRIEVIQAKLAHIESNITRLKNSSKLAEQQAVVRLEEVAGNLRREIADSYSTINKYTAKAEGREVVVARPGFTHTPSSEKLELLPIEETSHGDILVNASNSKLSNGSTSKLPELSDLSDESVDAVFESVQNTPPPTRFEAHESAVKEALEQFDEANVAVSPRIAAPKQTVLSISERVEEITVAARKAKAKSVLDDFRKSELNFRNALAEAASGKKGEDIAAELAKVKDAHKAQREEFLRKIVALDEADPVVFNELNELQREINVGIARIKQERGIAEGVKYSSAGMPEDIKAFREMDIIIENKLKMKPGSAVKGDKLPAEIAKHQAQLEGELLDKFNTEKEALEAVVREPETPPNVRQEIGKKIKELKSEIKKLEKSLDSVSDADALGASIRNSGSGSVGERSAAVAKAEEVATPVAPVARQNETFLRAVEELDPKRAESVAKQLYRHSPSPNTQIPEELLKYVSNGKVGTVRNPPGEEMSAILNYVFKNHPNRKVQLGIGEVDDFYLVSTGDSWLRYEPRAGQESVNAGKKAKAYVKIPVTEWPDHIVEVFKVAKKNNVDGFKIPASVKQLKRPDRMVLHFSRDEDAIAVCKGYKGIFREAPS